MAEAAELALSALTLFAVVVYLIVGRAVLRRPAPREGRPAVRGFALWWIGLAFVGVLGVLPTFGVDLTHFGLGPYLVFLYAAFALIFAMLGGLVYFLLYLYSGRRGWLGTVSLFYVLMMVAVVVLIQGGDPFIAVEDGERSLELRDQPATTVSLLFSLALLVPPLVAAVAYLLLGFRVDDSTTKYRIFMTSGGIALWMLYSLGSSVGRTLSGTETASLASQVVSQSLGLFAAVLVLLAYYPPRMFQERFGLRSIADETADAARAEAPQPRVIGGHRLPVPTSWHPGPANAARGAAL